MRLFMPPMLRCPACFLSINAFAELTFCSDIFTDKANYTLKRSSVCPTGGTLIFNHTIGCRVSGSKT